jgi:hypothetical protein
MKKHQTPMQQQRNTKNKGGESNQFHGWPYRETSTHDWQYRWETTCSRQSSSRTPMVALLTRTHIICKTLHPCSVRNHPKETDPCKDSEMCRLHVWSHDKVTLENKSTTR